MDPKSQTLIDDAQNNILNQKAELLALQDKYNTTLKKYQDANTNLQTAMKSFMNSTDSGGDKNMSNGVVYVDTLVEDPSTVDVSYVGAYEADGITNRASWSYSGTNALNDDLVIIGDLYDEENGVMTANYLYNYIESCIF